MKDKINNFNNNLAITITKAVGSMWCAYLFFCLSLISLPSAIESHNIITIVSWIAQTMLQLVLLSIIQKGQNIGNDKLDKTIEKIEENTEMTRKICESIAISEQKELEEIEEIQNNNIIK